MVYAHVVLKNATRNITIVQRMRIQGWNFPSLESLDAYRILFINWFEYVSLDDSYQLRKIYLKLSTSIKKESNL